MAPPALTVLLGLALRLPVAATALPSPGGGDACPSQTCTAPASDTFALMQVKADVTVRETREIDHGPSRHEGRRGPKGDALPGQFRHSPVFSGISKPKDTTVSLPINSANRQAGTADIIALVGCLLVPWVIFGCKKAFEHFWAKAQAAQADTVNGATPSEVTVKQPLPPELVAVRTRRVSTQAIVPEATQTMLKPISFLRLGKDPEQEPADSRPVDEGSIVQNVFAGVATGMAALPDAISFSFITGSSPLNGIWAGVFMGYSAALVGGRPGMISSASAATAVVVAHISTDPDLGAGPMALCVFIVGILQLIIGALKLSRLIILVPHSVMLGFVNGLAIVMIRAQLRQFRHHGDGPWVEPSVAVGMVITALVSLISAVVWARIPIVGKYFPAPLASLIITIVFSIIFRGIIEPRTLGDVAGHETFEIGIHSIPCWDFPPKQVEWRQSWMWSKVLLTAVRFAIVGILESLMTQTLIDQITHTTSFARQECLGQGLGNILSSFFGLQGGCALIAQSLLNISSGGLSRLSAVVMATCLLLSVIALAPVMAYIPVAALVGLIVLIALNTFAWSSLEMILRINWLDTIVVVVVTGVTVWVDLATAVVVGVVLSTIGFAWHTATDVHLIVSQDEQERCVIEMQGPLFFGSSMNYQVAVSKLQIEQDVAVLDFTHGPVLDISGIDAVEKARETLIKNGKRVILRGIPDDSYRHLPLDVETEDKIAAETNRRSPLVTFAQALWCGSGSGTASNSTVDAQVSASPSGDS